MSKILFFVVLRSFGRDVLAERESRVLKCNVSSVIFYEDNQINNGILQRKERHTQKQHTAARFGSPLNPKPMSLSSPLAYDYPTLLPIY